MLFRSQGEIRRMPGALRFQRNHQMLLLPRKLLETGCLRKRGLQLACPSRDHGGPSKPHKISSLHAILVSAANATLRKRALPSSADRKTFLIIFIFMPFLPLVVERLGKIQMCVPSPGKYFVILEQR